MSYETEVAALTVAVNTVSSLVTTLETTTQSAYNVAVATAQTHAGTALAQANIAATQVALATTQKTLAITQATNAATSATTATTQAGIATTQAAAATAAAVGASNIVLGVSTLYPAIRPSLDLDFANSQTVDPRITFTRASTATRTNSRGLIELVPSGVPRIDFDAVTGACKGLLIEEQRTNLLTYSEGFDNAAWAKNNATVTANATTAPDGLVTADKLVESTATGAHSVYQTGVSVTSGSTYTHAVFAKASERSKLEISFNANNAAFADSQAVFDLVAGTSSSTNTISHGIRSMVNGWFLCWATEAATASAVCVVELRIFTSANVYTGDGTSGLFIFGAQLEAGAFPTSYIPTVASQVTRAADVATMTGANFSSWYRQDEGSFVAETLLSRQASSRSGQYALSDGATNSFSVFYRSSGATGLTVIAAGVTQADISPTGVIPANTPAKTSFSYRVNDFASSGNGLTVAADSSGTIPTLDRLFVGADIGNYINGHLRSLSYYPKRLTNAELVALSTQ